MFDPFDWLGLLVLPASEPGRIAIGYALGTDDANTDVQPLICCFEGDWLVSKPVMDTFHAGDAEFELDTTMRPSHEFRATDAEPGSPEKLEILATRIRQGLPLWHPQDRHAEDLQSRGQARGVGRTSGVNLPAPVHRKIQP